MSELNLREADKLEITVLIDNYTDVLLGSTDVVKRPALSFSTEKWPLAEHGLSCLLRIFSGSEEHVVLLDAGISTTCLLHNTDALDTDLSEVEAIVLSHGHVDHFGGLAGVLSKTKKRIPLVVHPDAFLPFRLNIPMRGILIELPSIDETALKDTGAELRKDRQPSTLASNLVLVLGEVERVTEFEKGMPFMEAKIDNEWIDDPFLHDQGVVVNVKGKGLVVISGCAHAGIINTVKYTQKVARTNKVHAVMGGFHLSGVMLEPIVGPTIEEIKKIGPEFVVPMHCTGWKTINRFAEEMPEQFALNSVGTTYVFQ